MRQYIRRLVHFGFADLFEALFTALFTGASAFVSLLISTFVPQCVTALGLVIAFTGITAGSGVAFAKGFDAGNAGDIFAAEFIMSARDSTASLIKTIRRFMKQPSSAR